MKGIGLILIITAVIIFAAGAGFLMFKKSSPDMEAALEKQDLEHKFIPIVIPEEKEKPQLNFNEASQELLPEKNSEKTNPKIISQIQETTDEVMTFVVTIPENTPEDDLIFLFIQGVGEFPMKKVKEREYRYVFKYEGVVSGSVNYRYLRNQAHIAEAEALAPENLNIFEGNTGRNVLLAPGKIQSDIVDRWRFFPRGEVARTSGLEPTNSFAPRINGLEFRSRQGIDDLYIEAFDPFFEPTAIHMKELGYRWAAFYPPWQWITSNPLPKVGNKFVLGIEDAPNYTDEKLLLQMREFKEEGLKIILAPQICCDTIDLDHRSSIWWEVYWDEVERFLMHHAKIAQEAGAEAFVADISFIGWSKDYGAEIMAIEQKAWRDIWKSVKEVFSGEVGQMVWNLGESISPEADFITWGDEVDFFWLQAADDISLLKNPTLAELGAGAKREINEAKELYDAFGKPVILQISYHSIKESWRGFEYEGHKKCDVDGSAREDDCADFSARDQALVTQAYFDAIKDTPWITGFFGFGYKMWERPLAIEWNMRGKEADYLWQKWNRVIYK